MLVYCSNITHRARYIISTILTATGAPQFFITDDKEQYILSSNASLNYSSRRLKQDEFFIEAHPLLSQNNIAEQDIEVFTSPVGYKAFFKNSGDFGFDVFAASFYLLTRYEEYLPNVKDTYGRYAHENSIAFKQNFLQLPLVNIWLADFTKKLKEYFPQLVLKSTLFKYLPTYDIDIAFLYKGKGILRNLKGIVADVAAFNTPGLNKRKSTLLFSGKDPADVYDWLTLLHKQCNLTATWFFLVAAKQKGYDKNISSSSPHLKELATKLSRAGNIGLHPSWQSGDDLNLLKQEKRHLQAICGIITSKSRQHYIRMTLPATYRSLLAAGIKEDYSMGYGSINGFRASYCLPYKWFDLEKNESTELMLFPFCFMDANANYEQQLSAEQAAEELQHYYEVVTQVNGLLVTIFHNHFLAETKQWQPWRSMYQGFLQKNFNC